MIRHSLALAATIALAAPAIVHAAEVEIEADGPVIELSITETVDAEPDLVTIGAGVTTEAASAVAALRENSVQMRAVIDRILALGVAPDDVQTTGINLNAQYNYDRTNQRQIFRGYQASNRVSVKLREVEETGEVLDALVAAGATDLSGPDFSIEDDEAAKDEARSRAIARAQDRAQSYAALFGYDGVRVLSISETIRGSIPRPVMRTAMVEEAAADISAPVQPGRVSTGVSISVKYEMTGGMGDEGDED
ncbi:MAG: SIMPL domain-containing protein [Erythrobacter sp.]